MKVLVAYFSGTGNTRAVAREVIAALSAQGAEVLEKDVTALADRPAGMDLGDCDAVVFGLPIYVNRAPRPLREWLGTLGGGGRKCSTFFTYGGVNSHPAHRSTRAILESRGFDLVSSAEFVGAHTFNRNGWEAAPGRPADADFELAREYATRTLARFRGEDAGRPGSFPEGKAGDAALDQMEAGMKQAIPKGPSRSGKECSMCMDCENLCANGAMDAAKGEADRDKCVLCLRCVELCPDGALAMADMSGMWKMVLEKNQTDKDTIASKKSELFF